MKQPPRFMWLFPCGKDWCRNDSDGRTLASIIVVVTSPQAIKTLRVRLENPVFSPSKALVSI